MEQRPVKLAALNDFAIDSIRLQFITANKFIDFIDRVYGQAFASNSRTEHGCYSIYSFPNRNAFDQKLSEWRPLQ